LFSSNRDLIDITAPNYVRHRGMVMTCLVAFCITVLGEVIIQWYGVNQVFTTYGDTRLEIYAIGLAGLNFPQLGVVSLILTYSMQIIADSLMVKISTLFNF